MRERESSVRGLKEGRRKCEEAGSRLATEKSKSVIETALNRRALVRACPLFLFFFFGWEIRRRRRR